MVAGNARDEVEARVNENQKTGSTENRYEKPGLKEH
jgi:hypothetical protein